MKRKFTTLKKLHPAIWGFVGVLALLIGFLGLAHYQIYALTGELALLSSKLDDNTAKLAVQTETLATNISALDEKANSLSGALDETKAEVQNTRSQVQTVESQVGGVAQAVGTISGTVDTLEKLSKTDPELLQKYSKVFFLNEHYAPERVTEIPKKYLYIEREPEVIHAAVWPHLQSLLLAAEQASQTLYVRSAYRSFDEQEALKGHYTVVYGAGTANQFSADQGYSEHQLGTTVDFITTGLGGNLDGFENTKEYTWLVNNAHHYGFTLSYPPNNSFYVFEPWHWRYVGKSLATELRRQGKYFYDLEQREIDEYLVNLFE